MMRRGLQIGVGVGVLLGVQTTAWLIYRAVEDSRGSDPPSAFAYDAISGLAPGLAVPLEDPNGKLTRLKQHASESVVVHFWATWCEPCRTELPALLALASAAENPRVRFLFVSVDGSWATVHHFFDGEIPSGVVRDATGAAKQAFSVQSLPETFVLRPGAALRARIRGARDWRSNAAREKLAVLAAAPK